MDSDSEWVAKLDRFLQTHSVAIWVILAACTVIVLATTVPYLIAEDTETEELPSTEYNIYDEKSSEFVMTEDASRHISIKMEGDIDTRYSMGIWFDHDRKRMTYVGTYIHNERYSSTMYDVDGYTEYGSSSDTSGDASSVNAVTYTHLTKFEGHQRMYGEYTPDGENECTLDNQSTLVTRHTGDRVVTDMPAVNHSQYMSSSPAAESIFPIKKVSSDEYSIASGLQVGSNGSLVRVKKATGSIKMSSGQIKSADLSAEATVYDQVSVLGAKLPMVDPTSKKDVKLNYMIITNSGEDINLERPPVIDKCFTESPQSN